MNRQRNKTALVGNVENSKDTNILKKELDAAPMTSTHAKTTKESCEEFIPYSYDDDDDDDELYDKSDPYADFLSREKFFQSKERNGAAASFEVEDTTTDKGEFTNAFDELIEAPEVLIRRSVRGKKHTHTKLCIQREKDIKKPAILETKRIPTFNFIRPVEKGSVKKAPVTEIFRRSEPETTNKRRNARPSTKQ